MKAKLRRSGRPSRRLLIGICLLLLVVGVAADGPVNIVAGVAQTGDNNDSEGETWGRPGGRTVTYSVSDTSAYDTLWFGATSLPTAAFDNAVNAAGETMAFDATNSDLANGKAVWSGSAFLPLAGGQPIPSQFVTTRFTMTIKNSGNVGVPLTNYPGGPTPGADIKTIGSSFSINMQFSVVCPSGFGGICAAGSMVPLLNFYDASPTPVGNPPDDGGPALTGFSKGFFFTNLGLTLQEHEDSMTAQHNAISQSLNSIKNDTSFTKAEVTGGLAGLANTLGEVRNSVVMQVQPNIQNINNTTNNISTRVNDIYNIVRNQSPGGPPVQIPPDIATKQNVNDAKDQVVDILMILLGLKPCPLPAADCANLTFMPQVAKQDSLEEVKLAVNGLPTQATINQISSAIGALPTQANVGQVLQVLSQLASQSSVDAVSQALNILATSASVEQVKQRLIDLALAVDGIKQTVNLPAVQRLDVQVVETSDAVAGKKRRWLVRSSVAGAPAPATLTGLVAITPSKSGPSTATQVLSAATVTQLMPGLMEVTVETAEGKLNDLSFNFSISHASPGGSLTTGILIGLLK